MSSQSAARAKSPMTLEEFLAWDGGGHVGKLELVEGVVRAMAPASATHSIIQLNIGTAINNHLRAKQSPCRVGTEAPIVPPLHQRVNARAPDVSVTCSPPADNGTFVDPVLIVEVMSPSDEEDTWDSINALAGLQTLREVLVAQSTRVEVQIFRRDAKGAWISEPDTMVAITDTIRLASIDLDLAVAEIYRGTQFEA